MEGGEQVVVGRVVGSRERRGREGISGSTERNFNTLGH